MPHLRRPRASPWACAFARGRQSFRTSYRDAGRQRREVGRQLGDQPAACRSEDTQGDSAEELESLVRRSTPSSSICIAQHSLQAACRVLLQRSCWLRQLSTKPQRTAALRDSTPGSDVSQTPSVAVQPAACRAATSVGVVVSTRLTGVREEAREWVRGWVSCLRRGRRSVRWAVRCVWGRATDEECGAHATDARAWAASTLRYWRVSFFRRWWSFPANAVPVESGNSAASGRNI